MRTFRWTPLLILLLIATACGDDDGALPVGSTSTTAGTTTTGATTTAPTTTTLAPTTTAPTTTTTTLSELPPIEFRPDGIGFADFGDDAATVLGIAVGLFGEPSSDSGWQPSEGMCPGDFFRSVSFLDGTLTLMFGDVEDFFAGRDNFIHYSYGGTTPITDGPPISIDVGTTVAQATAIWPGATVDGDFLITADVFYFDPGPGYGYLFAELTGTNPSDTIFWVAGGEGCGQP